MKKYINIISFLCIAFFFNTNAVADTYPVAGKNRYLKGCFGEERSTHDHNGVDIVGPRPGDIQGESVEAFRKGVITYAGYYNEQSGNVVKIKHSDGFSTSYCHLEDISNDFEEKYRKYVSERDPEKKKLLRKKLEVTEGEEIGEVGNTGTTGHHLHFIIKRNKKADDPQKYLDFDMHSTTTGCGYPEVKSMGVVADKKKKSRGKVIVEGLQEFTVYGNLRGERVTKLYLDEYAEMKIDKSKVEAKFKDAGKNKGKYQYKSKFKLGDHVADIKITNFKEKEVSKGHLDFAVDPVIRIKVLELEGGLKVVGELVYYNKNDAKIGGKLGEKLVGNSEFLSKILKEKVRVITRSIEKIWPSEITINPNGTADVKATPTGLEDGPHTAVIEILDENGQVTDSMQKILLSVYG